MLYIEYECIKKRYKRSVADVQDILQEIDALFAKTQPKSMQYDQDKVTSNNYVNALEQYVIAKEQRKVDERLKEAKSIMAEWKNLLDAKEAELRASKLIPDIIYTCRYIDRMRIRKIRQKTFYSDAQIYRILDRIKKEIENVRNDQI